VPLTAFGHRSTSKDRSKWGELVELEEVMIPLCKGNIFVIRPAKREHLRKFQAYCKKGRFLARAKELCLDSPSYKDVPYKNCYSGRRVTLRSMNEANNKQRRGGEC
ncbi:hypothetical protein Tco_0642664, partial [Tanacetum coccineum]